MTAGESALFLREELAMSEITVLIWDTVSEAEYITLLSSADHLRTFNYSKLRDALSLRCSQNCLRPVKDLKTVNCKKQ